VNAICVDRGGELTITASGDDVPAFTEQLVAPSKIVVTSPSGNGTLSIPIHHEESSGREGSGRESRGKKGSSR
jgi:hypothetical protein